MTPPKSSTDTGIRRWAALPSALPRICSILCVSVISSELVSFTNHNILVSQHIAWPAVQAVSPAVPKSARSCK